MATIFTPIVAGSEVTAASVNDPLEQLETAITTLNNVLDGNNNLVLAGDWNTAHLVMNNSHLWVNAGRLFFKANAAPTGPTDGTQIAP